MRPCWLITDGVLADAILIFTPPNNTAHQLKEGKGSAKSTERSTLLLLLLKGTIFSYFCMSSITSILILAILIAIVLF